MHVADGAGGHGQPAQAVGRMLALAQPGSGPVAVPGPQRRLPDADEVLAVLAARAALAELGEEPIDGGGVHAAEPQLTDGRDDLVLDQAGVAEHGALGNLTLAGPPLAPGVQQLGHGLVAGGAVLAGPGFPDEPGFELAGLGAGLGRAGLLALLAGEGIAAGVDDDPPAVAALLDHLRRLLWPGFGHKDDHLMIIRGKQGKPQEGIICALSCWFVEPEVGFEPTTFRLRVETHPSSRCQPGRFWLLRSAGSSVECDPDRRRYGRGNDQENDRLLAPACRAAPGCAAAARSAGAGSSAQHPGPFSGRTSSLSR